MTHTAAYQALTTHLAKLQYEFVCASPETQARVVRQRCSEVSTEDAKSAEDFFGWSLPCARQTLRSIIPDTVFENLLDASIITSIDNHKYRSTIRVSNFYLPHTQDDDVSGPPLYYIHSSFPASSDSVFFGPDTYLFVDFLRTRKHHLPKSPQSIIDVCCGSGAGAIHAARTFPRAKAIGLDLNPHALRLGGTNAQLAGTQVDFFESNLYAAIPHKTNSSGIDLIISNPPYIASSDEDGEDLPVYADGGADFGLDISIRIVEEGLKKLSSSGVIAIYTGVAIPTAKPGHDAFLEKLRGLDGVKIVEYAILHPDMWSEEIGQGAYAYVCRIQAVGAVLRKK